MPEEDIQSLLTTLKVQLTVMQQRRPDLFRDLISKDRLAKEAARGAIVDALAPIIRSYHVTYDDRRRGVAPSTPSRTP